MGKNKNKFQNFGQGEEYKRMEEKSQRNTSQNETQSVSEEERRNSPYPKKSLFFSKNRLQDLLKAKSLMGVQEISKRMIQLQMAIQQILDKRFVMMENKNVWFDRNVAGLYPKFDKVSLPYISTYYGRKNTYASDNVPGLKKDENGLFSKLVVEGIDFEMMTDEEGWKTFLRGNNNPYIDVNEGIRDVGCNNRYYCTDNCYNLNNYYLEFSSIYGNEEKYNEQYKEQYVVLIPIHRLNGKDGKAMSLQDTLIKWFELGLIPEGLDENTKKIYQDLMSIHTKLTDNDWLEHYSDAQWLQDFYDKQNGGVPSLFGYNLMWKNAYENAEKTKTVEADVLATIEDWLLKCDFERIHLSPYSKDQVEDNENGHWELDGDDCQGSGLIEITIPAGRRFIARPPHMDVDDTAVCAIDFGTKSTVVVLYKKGESRLVRVGKGDLSKAATDLDYENPTVMQFRHINDFIQSYKGREGRPHTRWEDLLVSHAAVDRMQAEDLDSDICYSFFGELKQWANDKERRFLMIDLDKVDYKLAPYLRLKDEVMDPIEIYAYYLASYINNMHEGICLQYTLSFPVNYEKAVREKIRSSFEKGIKKSLPCQVLKDKYCMDVFEVSSLASEPAAYAASALKKFKLEPQEGSEDKVCYAVFDFGGGTTDFDFGIETRYKEQRKYKFQIEQFGKGGEPYLGGENLLNLIAYQVYCNNEELMRNKKITIVRPHDGPAKAGMETLICESGKAPAKARMNLKNLSEVLRSVWEGGNEILSGKKVKLYSEEVGKPKNYNLVSDSAGDNGEVDNENIDDKPESKHETASQDYYTGNEVSQKDRNEELEKLEKLEKLSNVLKERIDQHAPNSEPGDNDSASQEAGNNDEIKVDVKELNDIIQKRIDKTVKNFFESMFRAFEDKDMTKVHIFLAGNSCKSVIVNELFKNYKGEWESRFEQEFPNRDTSGIIEIHQPLGMNNDLSQNVAIDKKVTGKTGVAFGLVRLRSGGKDIKIVNGNEDESGEIRFPYFLGEEGDNNTFRILIGLDVGYGEWAEFCYADEKKFSIYFTRSTVAQTGELHLKDVDGVICLLSPEETKDEDSYRVYVRKVSPDTIEYAVGTKEDFANPDKVKELKLQNKIHVKKLVRR